MADLDFARLTFDGARLTLAREYAGLRKVDLARAIEVTPAAITQYEQGRSRPSTGTLAALSLHLAFPLEFFEAGRPLVDVSEQTTHFRRLRSASRGLRRRLLARLELLAELIAIVDQHVALPAVALPPVDVSDDRAGTENAARLVRDAWGLEQGPIQHMVRLLEAKGAVVVGPRIDTTEVNAFSRWLSLRPVVVLASDKGDAAVSRFDAAHELGHLIMHHDAEPGDLETERQADVFAAAFLMPADAIANELPERLNWARYFDLKRRWGVPLPALVRRSRDLGLISQYSYDRAFVQISARGWRIPNEPAPLAAHEVPSVLPRALAMMHTKLGISSDELGMQLRLGGTAHPLFDDLALDAVA